MTLTVTCLLAGALFVPPPEWHVESIKPGIRVGICYAIDNGCEVAEREHMRTIVKLSRVVKEGEKVTLPPACSDAETEVKQ